MRHIHDVGPNPAGSPDEDALSTLGVSTPNGFRSSVGPPRAFSNTIGTSLNPSPITRSVLSTSGRPSRKSARRTASSLAG
ncbi:MAG: hypothetical protein U0414_35240 [Polyangiaceae bacterium]